MIYELRTYTCYSGKQAAQVEAMEKAMPILERHGIRLVGVWTTIIGRSEELVWMLEYESLADREKKWAEFHQDPELRKLLNELGPVAQFHENKILQPTAFSPLR